MTAADQLSSVRLIKMPLRQWHQGRVWFEGLLREFDILASDAGETTPQEVLEFAREVRERFSQFTEGSNAVLEEAYRRGDESVDLELKLPREAAPAAREMATQIHRAQEYCRRGDLLTLTPDEDLRRYIDWYLEEVARQLEGGSPRPWNSQPPTR